MSAGDMKKALKNVSIGRMTSALLDAKAADFNRNYDKRNVKSIKTYNLAKESVSSLLNKQLKKTPAKRKSAFRATRSAIASTLGVLHRSRPKNVTVGDKMGRIKRYTIAREKLAQQLGRGKMAEKMKRAIIGNTFREASGVKYIPKPAPAPAPVAKSAIMSRLSSAIRNLRIR